MWKLHEMVKSDILSSYLNAETIEFGTNREKNMNHRMEGKYYDQRTD